MLMAAGLGTRLRPFTEVEPKALLPVLGIPCAQFAVDAATRAGASEIIANVHHLSTRTREGLARLDLRGAGLRISDESALLLGSAGGIAKALPFFEGEPFYLLNADVLCEIDLLALARCHRRLRERHGAWMTLAVFENRGSGEYREIRMDTETGLITGFGEVRAAKPYFVGAAVLEPEALRGVSREEPSEFLPKILEPAILEKRAGFYLTSGQWFDIGSPELWRGTHLQLMKGLETGEIPSEWRRRIEAINHRIGPQMWVSRKSRRSFATAGWIAPAYFDSLGDSTAKPTREFGPGSILYGAAEPRERLEGRIGFRGLRG